MSKEAVVKEIYNNFKKETEYFVKGINITESIKFLIKKQKQEFDKEIKNFAAFQRYIAQKENEAQIANLERKIILYKKSDKFLNEQLNKATEHLRTLNEKFQEKSKKLEMAESAYKTLMRNCATANCRLLNSRVIEQLENMRSEIPFLAGITQNKTFFVNYKQLTNFVDNKISDLRKEQE